MKTDIKQTTTKYFGMKVEVISKMDKWSLIRFRERVFIVETTDLVEVQSSKRAA